MAGELCRQTKLTVTPELGAIVSAVIPCLNEEEAIVAVVHAVRGQGVAEIVVVDGGSTDQTVERAVTAGARVVSLHERGYGRAIKAGIAALRPDTTVVLFLDGDGSDPAEAIPKLILPIVKEQADFVSGSRLRGKREPGSLSPQQIIAGRLAGLLIRAAYGVRFTDMSPYRAIRRNALDQLGMREATFGWNLEMQMRAAAAGLRVLEVPVGQRRRAGGVSKVSGNLRASLRAAWSIASTFTRLAVDLRRRSIP